MPRNQIVQYKKLIEDIYQTGRRVITNEFLQKKLLEDLGLTTYGSREEATNNMKMLGLIKKMHKKNIVELRWFIVSEEVKKIYGL